MSLPEITTVSPKAQTTGGPVLDRPAETRKSRKELERYRANVALGKALGRFYYSASLEARRRRKHRCSSPTPSAESSTSPTATG